MGKATRVPVSITAEERAEIEGAMKQYGFRAMSEFMRFAAIAIARKGAS